MSVEKSALKTIAITFGMEKKSTTASTVATRAAEIVAERDQLKADVEKMAARIKELEDNQFALPKQDTLKESSKRNVAYSVLYAPGQEPGYIALNNGFEWDDKLSAVLSHPSINPTFSKMQFNNYSVASRLSGGEEFKDDSGANVVVVGHLPSRPKFSICAVHAWKLDDEEYVLKPEDLRLFNVDYVVRNTSDAEQLKQLQQERVTKYASKYGIWPEAVQASGFELTLRDIKRLVRVVDLSATPKKRPITVSELHSSAEPGKLWHIPVRVFSSVEPPRKRARVD